jgi:hypothetical protein
MVCGTYGAMMAEVSGKAGGYYGRLAATDATPNAPE